MTKKILLLMMICSVNTVFALNTRVATFSVGRHGGEEFKNLTGVIEVSYGFAFGEIHREVIQIKYNEDIISYRQLLNVFFRMIDPTDMFGSFEDRDVIYSPAIYTSDDAQTQLANYLIQKIKDSRYFSKPIVVRVIDEFAFLVISEDIQQDSVPYNLVKSVSARSTYTRMVWDKIPQEFFLVDSTEGAFLVDVKIENKFENFVKPPKKQLRDDLTEAQYSVTQLGVTEPQFFEDVESILNNTNRGLYVDIVSGEPLFSSTDKVDSNTGWLTFRRPFLVKFIKKIRDMSLFYERIEVRSRYADSHIGYVVDDVYQVNGSALRFIPFDQLEEEGYEDYKSLI